MKPNYGTKAVVRKPDPNWTPGEGRPRAAALPAGTYRAVLTVVRNVPKSQRDIEWESQQNHKDISEIDPRKWEWIFHIKSRKTYAAIDSADGVEKIWETYNRELSADTSVSLWQTSKAYKWSGKLLGYDLDENTEFDMADLHGTRCLLAVTVKVSKTTGRPYNNIADVIGAEDDADWDTDPPEGFQYERPEATEATATAHRFSEAPHPADIPGVASDPESIPGVQRASQVQVSAARRELKALLTRKGIPLQQGNDLLQEYCVRKGWKDALGKPVGMDDLSPEAREAVLDYFERTYEDGGGADLPF